MSVVKRCTTSAASQTPSRPCSGRPIDWITCWHVAGTPNLASWGQFMLLRTQPIVPIVWWQLRTEAISWGPPSQRWLLWMAAPASTSDDALLEQLPPVSSRWVPVWYLHDQNFIMVDFTSNSLAMVDWSICLMRGIMQGRYGSSSVCLMQGIMVWIWEVLKCMSHARTSQYESEKCWWHYFLQRMQIAGCTVFGVFPRGLDYMTYLIMIV